MLSLEDSVAVSILMVGDGGVGVLGGWTVTVGDGENEGGILDGMQVKAFLVSIIYFGFAFCSLFGVVAIEDIVYKE